MNVIANTKMLRAFRLADAMTYMERSVNLKNPLFAAIYKSMDEERAILGEEVRKLFPEADAQVKEQEAARQSLKSKRAIAVQETKRMAARRKARRS